MLLTFAGTYLKVCDIINPLNIIKFVHTGANRTLFVFYTFLYNQRAREVKLHYDIHMILLYQREVRSLNIIDEFSEVAS